MSGGTLPPEVLTFLGRHIDSVVRLEVLLLLHATPETWLQGPDAARELRIEPAWATAQLEELVTRQLAIRDISDGTTKYRYSPANPVLAAQVDMLAREFFERRVAIISAIYSQPPDPVRNFSDAFIFKRGSGGSHG